MVEHKKITKQQEVLGCPNPERYLINKWPVVLLTRMAYWVRRVHKHGALLDLGCAEGALLELLGAGGIGLDMNPQRLRLAHEKGFWVSVGDGNRMPFPDNCFDTVICMEVLEHVPDMTAIMREVHRVLRPGGYWVISVPSVTLRSWYEMWHEKRPYYCDDNEHYREFSSVRIPWFEHLFELTTELEQTLVSNGFSIRHQDGVHYVFPQWFSRLPALQKVLESPATDRILAHIPWVRSFPYWMVRVVRKV